MQCLGVCKVKKGCVALDIFIQMIKNIGEVIKIYTENYLKNLGAKTMNEKFNDITHSNLSFLKELEQYTFDSKMILCQKYSSRIMDGSKVNMELAFQENIMPWELEVLSAFSVVYDSIDAKEIFNEKKFADIITKIRNFWHPELTITKEKGTYPQVYMMISMLQQFPTQGEVLQKLFRYNYFFNFKNENINMVKEFKDKFDLDYEALELFAFVFFIAMSTNTREKLDPFTRKCTLEKLFSMNSATEILSIDKRKYREKLLSLYKRNDLDYYYGLKVQYQYPIIEGDNYTYIPTPYLIINAVTESLLNRLTFGNEKLRNNFGKEVVEKYLYHIYSEVSSIEWISTELTYKIGKQEYRTADILVGENNCCIFFDTKALSPSLKIRKFDREEIEKATNLYAESIIQVYTQILNYLDGQYELEKKYEKENIFGVVVVLEDAYISREAVYARVFDILSIRNMKITQGLRNYINSHVKVIPLRQIEEMVLGGSSYLPCLLNQVNNSEDWNNYNFYIPNEKVKIIPSLSLYENYIKEKSRDLIHQIALEINR